MPTPYDEGAHGTEVASVAAGKNLGVAPEATVIPIARNLSDDQGEENLAGAALRFAITLLPTADRGQLDDILASSYRDDYAKFDIINRSFGIEIFDPDIISSEINSELLWYRRYLPKTLNAVFQVGTPDARKTILVYAAGNSGQAYSGLGADLPYYYTRAAWALPVCRGDGPAYGGYRGLFQQVRVPPVRLERREARTALLPSGSRHSARSHSQPKYAGFKATYETGYKAPAMPRPIVSGALALLKEHFRGRRGNAAIVKRMIDTANRSAHYADLETYGAGHRDIAAALSPVGSLSAGQSAQALSRTTLRVPAAFGSVARRATSIELAAFDKQDFPFWVPLSGLISARSDRRSPIPEFLNAERTDTPATGLGALGLHWAMPGDAGGLPFLDDREWVMGLGQSIGQPRPSAT